VGGQTACWRFHLKHLLPVSTGDLGSLLKTKFKHFPRMKISMDFP